MLKLYQYDGNQITPCLNTHKENHIMQGHTNASNKPDIAKDFRSTKIMRRLIATRENLNCLIDWWYTNINDVHTDPKIIEKCHKEMIPPFKSHLKKVSKKIDSFEKRAICARKILETFGSESVEFETAYKQINETQRELGRLFDSSGPYMQAHITKWFHETDYFEIADIEVHVNGCDFDIMIADPDGTKYAVEVWFGKNKYQHATRESTRLGEIFKGQIHSDHVQIPERLQGVASDHGAISLDPKHDLPKICEKLAQLPYNHIGFLIACRTGDLLSTLHGTDFPIVPLDEIPVNKCIVVLNLGSSTEFGERGKAFLVNHPDFKHVKVGKMIIQSLGFEYDQSIYDEKIKRHKDYNLI